jgi:hypothetical protein
VLVPALPRAHGRSRMTRSLTRYIGHTGGQAFRTLLHSKPLTLFGRSALAMLVVSGALSTWFLVGYQDGGLHLPALFAALIALVLAVGLFISGLIADGVSANQRLLEDALYRIKRLEHDQAAARLRDASDELAA